MRYLYLVYKYIIFLIYILGKIGYIPEDVENNFSGEKLISKLINENQITKEDVLGDCHCMHPNFL